MKYSFFLFFSAASALIAVPIAASANGFGEAQGWQFRTPSERQVLTNQEQVRLQFMGSASSSIGAPGVGQTGNQISITVTGNGDNDIDLDQDNTGDQSIIDVAGDENATNGPPASTSITAAAAALTSID